MKRILLLAGVMAIFAACSDSNDKAADGLTNGERTLVARLDRIEPTTGQEIAAWTSSHERNSRRVPEALDQNPVLSAVSCVFLRKSTLTEIV